MEIFVNKDLKTTYQFIGNTDSNYISNAIDNADFVDEVKNIDEQK